MDRFKGLMAGIKLYHFKIFTFRIDTLHIQGSNTTFEAFAVILQRKQNWQPHFTQLFASSTLKNKINIMCGGRY